MLKRERLSLRCIMWHCKSRICPLCAHLDHVSDVALRPGVVRLVLLTHQDDEVQVVPDVVLQFDVFLKRHRLIVKLVSLQTCGSIQSERSQNSSVVSQSTRCARVGFSSGYPPQIKHVVFRISSFFCFSLLRSANVSMMTPKIRFRTMMMTIK